MVGKVTTQGDAIVRSHLARQIFNVDGSGIKIGIISDSFNALNGATTDIANGDLPGVGNPNGFDRKVKVLQDLSTSIKPSVIDEGRAVAQIVHDVAPGAEILFHRGDDENGRRSSANVATAIKELANAGADIIVDDLVARETLYQDDLAPQAVEEVTSKGVSYFTAATNAGNRSYEAPFRASNNCFSVAKESFSPELQQAIPNFSPEDDRELSNITSNSYIAHDFDPNEGVDLFQEINLPKGQRLNFLMGWSEAVGKVNSDLAMFVLDKPQLPNAGGKILNVSDETNDKPIEGFSFSSETEENRTVYLAIAKRQNGDNSIINRNPDLIKWIDNANNKAIYEYVNKNPGDRGSSTIYGLANARNAISVGAVDANNPFQIEEFSDSSSTPILFDPQGNRLPIPEIRQKPEIVAPNRVSTATTNSPAFDTFGGTSAAAPHAAAVAALILEQAGGTGSLTPQQLRQILTNTDAPVISSGFTPSNNGLIQADVAVAQTPNAPKLARDDLFTSGNSVLVGGSDDLMIAGVDKDIFALNSNQFLANLELLESQDLLFSSNSGITDSSNFARDGSTELATLDSIAIDSLTTGDSIFID
jgi:subtilisin family serine protease